MDVHFIKNKKIGKSGKNKSFHGGILGGSNSGFVSADTILLPPMIVL